MHLSEEEEYFKIWIKKSPLRSFYISLSNLFLSFFLISCFLYYHPSLFLLFSLSLLLPPSLPLSLFLFLYLPLFILFFFLLSHWWSFSCINICHAYKCLFPTETSNLILGPSMLRAWKCSFGKLWQTEKPTNWQTDGETDYLQ